eukprot:scaffold84585_cov35-Tisochrysis_lutea.AAC.2
MRQDCMRCRATVSKAGRSIVLGISLPKRNRSAWTRVGGRPLAIAAVWRRRGRQGRQSRWPKQMFGEVELGHAQDGFWK